MTFEKELEFQVRKAASWGYDTSITIWLSGSDTDENVRSAIDRVAGDRDKEPITYIGEHVDGRRFVIIEGLW